MSEIKLYPRELDQLLKSPQGPVGKDLEAKAAEAEELAERLAPFLTGALRDSITHVIGEDSEGLFALVGSDLDYALAQEFGTADTEAQPFLRPVISKRL